MRLFLKPLTAGLHCRALIAQMPLSTDVAREAHRLRLPIKGVELTLSIKAVD